MNTIECDGSHLWTIKDKRDGLVKTLRTEDIVKTGADNFLFKDSNGDFTKKISKLSKMDNERVKCIKVNDSSHLYEANGVLTHNTGGGKSVLQRAVVFHAIAHYKELKFLGIDLKRVELTAYKKYTCCVLGIATTLENAVEVLRFAQETMMNRYGDMEAVGKNNFLDMENAGPALLVMVDEAGELLDNSGGAKALIASTPVPSMENALSTMGTLRPGDHVLGEDGRWHVVTDKYIAESQSKYELTFRRESDGKTESVIAGEKHWWTCYIPQDLMTSLPLETEYELTHTNNSDEHVDAETNDVVKVLTTEELYSLYGSIPEDRRRDIRFKRAKNTVLSAAE